MFGRGKPPRQELKFILNLKDVQEEVVDANAPGWGGEKHCRPGEERVARIKRERGRRMRENQVHRLRTRRVSVTGDERKSQWSTKKPD